MSRVIALSIFLFVMSVESRGQGAEQPFTRDELLAVYRRLLPGDVAERIAEATLHEPVPAVKAPVVPAGRPGMAFDPKPANVLSDDTLILLSFLSPEAAAKVARYRAQLWAGAIPASEEVRWRERIRQLRAWADAGYPRSR